MFKVTKPDGQPDIHLASLLTYCHLNNSSKDFVTGNWMQTLPDNEFAELLNMLEGEMNSTITGIAVFAYSSETQVFDLELELQTLFELCQMVKLIVLLEHVRRKNLAKFPNGVSILPNVQICMEITKEGRCAMETETDPRIVTILKKFVTHH